MINIKLKKIIEYLVYLFVALIPWQTRYIYKYLKLDGEIYEYGKLSFYASELILLLIIFLFLFLKKKHKDLSKTLLLSFLFLILTSINYFFASNHELYFYAFFKICECLAFLFILKTIKFDKLKLAIFFIGSILIHCFLGIFQFVNQYVFSNKYLGVAEKISNLGGTAVIETFSGRFLRIYGAFPHPNVFGGFLVVAILLLIFIYSEKIKNERLLYKVILYFTLSFLVVYLILTFSRSAILALFLTMIILLIFTLRRGSFKLFLPIFLVIFLTFLVNFFIFNDLFLTRLSFENRLEIQSIQERRILNNQANVLLKDNIFLGLGLNNYVLENFKKLNQNKKVWEYQPVHNVYLLTWIELGFLGFLIYILIFLSKIREKLKKINDSNIILILILCSILIINLFDHYFWTSWSGLILSFLILSL